MKSEYRKLRRWLRRLLRRPSLWWWLLWNKPKFLPAFEPVCEHDVQPVGEGAEWGRCAKCGEDGFPLTDFAACGEVGCQACHDTGTVAATLVSRPDALAQAPCPRCELGEARIPARPEVRRGLKHALSRGRDWDTFGRRWCRWPVVSCTPTAVFFGVGIYLTRLDGVDIEPMLVGHWQVGVEFNPCKWRFCQYHDWYDGPHCRYSFGPFAYSKSGGACAKCAGEGGLG